MHWDKLTCHKPVNHYLYQDSLKKKEVMDNSIHVSDRVKSTEAPKKKTQKRSTYSPPAKIESHSYATDSDDEDEDDEMRGFDPASEDDMDDNGMDRYMENDDEEGWI